MYLYNRYTYTWVCTVCISKCISLCIPPYLYVSPLIYHTGGGREHETLSLYPLETPQMSPFTCPEIDILGVFLHLNPWLTNVKHGWFSFKTQFYPAYFPPSILFKNQILGYTLVYSFLSSLYLHSRTPLLIHYINPLLITNQQLFFSNLEKKKRNVYTIGIHTYIHTYIT